MLWAMSPIADNIIPNPVNDVFQLTEILLSKPFNMTFPPVQYDRLYLIKSVVDYVKTIVHGFESVIQPPPAVRTPVTFVIDEVFLVVRGVLTSLVE